MRILLISQFFQPEPTFKGLPFARAMKEKGHEVEVLTGFPNYPGGRLYSGYRVRFYQQETMDGIKVHRVPLYPSHDQSTFRRVFSYISFAVSAFFGGPWLVRKPDVIYVYNLITLGPVAFLLRFLYGAKVIIDVQDIWPESVANSKMIRNKAALNLLKGICNWIYRRADHLVGLSPGFKKELVNRGILPEKIDVIYNWCDEASFSMIPPSSCPLKPLDFEGKFVVLYAGAMGPGQALDTVLDCAQLCKKTLSDVQFVLIGGGVDRARLEKRATEMGLENVSFMPARSIEKMGEVFAQADALLVHLKNDPLYRITIPSKTQAYLYIGKPIVMAVEGDAAALVHQAEAGVFCKSECPHNMLDAVKSLYEKSETERRRLGEAGHSFYMKNISFNTGVEKFEKLFHNVCNS